MTKTLLTAALAGMLLHHSAHAEATFQLFGGMGDGSSSAWSSGGQVLSFAPEKRIELQRKIVAFDRDMAPGSILVQTAERRLYYVLPGGQAEMFPIGVGREGFTWSGRNTITRKAEWPDWRPPANMIRREADRGHFIPAHMPGGPNNPLGARALYIGDTEFRIHGTTQPWSIGRAVSSGCIRMLNDHVIDLYDKVQMGAEVVVE